MFWKNPVHPSSRVTETGSIYDKEYWRCFGGSWWLYNLPGSRFLTWHEHGCSFVHNVHFSTYSAKTYLLRHCTLSTTLYSTQQLFVGFTCSATYFEAKEMSGLLRGISICNFLFWSVSGASNSPNPACWQRRHIVKKKKNPTKQPTNSYKWREEVCCW